jgi:hypothetical protein
VISNKEHTVLIEELVRLGRPLVEGGLGPDEVLKIITDVTDPRAKNFFRNVLIAELPAEDGQESVVWRAQLGNDLEQEKKTDFKVETDRVVGIPFVIPSGGNSLNAQGCYGLPVYPCWERHLQGLTESAQGKRNRRGGKSVSLAYIHGFRKSSDEVLGFLEDRLTLTQGFKISTELLASLSVRIHKVAKQEFAGDAKRLGVLVLVRCEPGGFYTYGRRRTRHSLAESRLYPGRFIEPNLPKIVEAVWAARLAEGAEMGARDAGTCSVSGEAGRVVSAYCKAWPWAFPTWKCPVGHGGDTGLLVEGIGLSHDAYRALTMGASWFNRVTQKVRPYIVQEVFAPGSDGPGRELAQRRSATDLDTIFGAAFLLPLDDQSLRDPDFRRAFADQMLAMLEPQNAKGTLAQRQFVAVTGFDCFVPEEFDRRGFLLSLVYFSGDPSRGDIHLRACIQDVLPSVAATLKKLAETTAQEGKRLFELVHLAEKRQAYLFGCYQSVPYLLARGYGGAHLWNQLDRVLHRRPLSDRRVAANAAARMAGLAARLPDSRFDLAEEAIFYLCCREFIHQCKRGLTTAPGEEGMPMRPWRELLHAVERGPIEELRYANGAELGFGCGALIHRFSWKYQDATGQKDYLKNRVMTFGANLSPDTVWKVGLRQMFEVAQRYDDLRTWFEKFFQDRVGATLAEFDRLKDEVHNNRDEFMTGFWAGYSLQGYDVRKSRGDDAGKNDTTDEGGEG